MKWVFSAVCALLCCGPVLAQRDGSSDILYLNDGRHVDQLMRYAGNIHQFNQIFQQETVFLQFDNTAYFEGETIWFKAFVVKSSTLTRSRSRVLYVDLLSPNGVLLQQKKLLVRSGQADGSFTLMDRSTEEARQLRGVQPYPSGYYEVRAYTQNMLDFNDNSVFSRVLPVYRKPSVEDGWTEAEIDVSKSRIEQLRPETGQTDDVSVTFYPEGGVWLKGVTCNVAYKAMDRDGRCLDGELVIRNAGPEGEDLVSRTLHDGMGSFRANTVKSSLKGVFTCGGRSYEVRIPAAVSDGYSLIVSNLPEKDSLEITLNRNVRSLTDSLGVTVICRGELFSFSKMRINGSTACARLSTTDWPLGVCRITVYTDLGEAVASRSVYHYNRSFVPPSLTAETDKPSYGPFERIRMSFHLNDRTGAPIRDRFCLSVRDASDLGTGYGIDLLTSLLLSSDIRGFIHNPDYYFESDDSVHRAAMDLLMQVQGWERYEWNYMSGSHAFEEHHRLEDSLNLNGWILAPSSDLKLQDVNVFATVIPEDGDRREYFEYTTGKNGYYGFNVSDYFGEAELRMFITSPRRRGSRGRIQLERAMTPHPRAIYAEEKYIPAAGGTGRDSVRVRYVEPDIRADGILLPQVDITGASRKYIDYYTFKAFDVEKDVETVLDWGEHPTDIQGYLLDKGYTFWLESSGYDYADSLTDERSIIRWMSQVSQLDGFDIFWYVHDSRRSMYIGDCSPSWTIDTRNVKSLMVYDSPMEIYEIAGLAPLLAPTSVIRSSTDGRKRLKLIDVQLKERYRQLSKRDINDLSRRITTLRGYSYPTEFYSPQYPDGPIDGEPDYRRTLYWNPNVITDAEGHASVEFYNNSYSTHFNVSGAGITASGTPYVLDAEF